MASYLSKPTQYAPYQPQVDAELYGKMILKKEEEYQSGFQKAQKNIDYYGSIPVSNLEEQTYLKEKIGSITNAINRNTNINWGDQSVQQLTGEYIKSIGSDKNIQTAIYNASLLKKHHRSYGEDVDKYGEAAVADNTSIYDRKYNEWYANGKIGTKLNFGYTSYVDVNKGVTDYLKELHPQSRVTPVLNKDITQPEQTIYTVEGLSPEIVAAEVKAYLDTTPGARDQIKVSAENRYAGFGPNEYVQMKKAINNNQLEINTQAIHEKSLQLASTTNDAEKEKLNLEIATLNTNNEELKKYDYEADKKAFEENADQWKHNTYESVFTQGIVGKYTYGNKYKVDYSGKLPWERQMEEKKYELELEKFQLTQDKWKAKNTPVLGTDDITVKKELSPTEVSSLYSNLSKRLVDGQESYKNEYINRVGDILKGTPIYNNYFVKEGGQYKLRNNGTDLIEGTNIKAIDYFFNGYTDADNVQHPGILDEWNRVIDNGKDFSVDKNGKVKVSLDNYSKMKLNELRDQKSLLDADMQTYLYVNREISRNPEVEALQKYMDQLDKNPGKIYLKSGEVITYTKKQLLDYFKAADEYWKYTVGAFGQLEGDPYNVANRKKREDIEKKADREIFQKYGITPEVLNAYRTDPEIHKIQNISNSVTTKRIEIANNILKDRGYAYQPTLIQWTKQVTKDDAGPYTPTDEQIKERLQTYVVAKGLNWDNAFDGDANAKKIIESKEPINVSYWWDKEKGRYGIAVSNTSADEPAVMYITEQAAAGLKMKTSKPSTDIIYQKMLKYGGSTYAPGQVPTFNNAEYLNTIKGKRTNSNKKEVEGNWIYRYHAEDKGSDGFHFIVYVTNSEDPKSPAEKVNDYIVPSTDWEDAKKQFLDKLK